MIDSWYEGFLEEGSMANLTVYDQASKALYVNGSLIQFKSKPPLYSVSAKPYPWDLNLNDRISINADCLSGPGKSALPIEFRTDGEVFAPDGEQVLYSGFGSYASPVYTIPAQNPSGGEVIFFGSSGFFKIPWKLMYLGLGIRIMAELYKPDADASATVIRARMGQSATSPSGDYIAAPTTAAAANSHITLDAVVRITKLGPLTTGQFTTPGNTKEFTSATLAADLAADRKTLFSTTADNYITFSTSTSNITMTEALVKYSISLVP